MSELGKNILQRMIQLKEVRKVYETGMWTDITRFVNPRRENIGQDEGSLVKGQRRGRDCYNGTPNSALSVWRDGMQGWIVSEALAWFKASMTNPFLNTIDEIRGWMQDYDLAMYSSFSRSNFYSVLPEWFGDAGSIGTATLYVEEDIDNKCAIFTSLHPREVYIAEDKFGRVDTVYRDFVMTARAAYQKFGENCSRLLIENAEKHPLKEHKIIHAVYPNKDRAYGKSNSSNKKFRSVYIEAEASNDDLTLGRVLRDSGYDLMPYIVWRFRKNSDEIYGYSPAADALVEIFGLNQISKDLLDASHISVRPPMNIPAEQRGNIHLGPDGRNYFTETDRVISAINTGINYPIGTDREERIEKTMKDKFRVDLFIAISNSTREKTKAEIMEIQSEKSILQGPQVDRLIDEGLKHIFDIVSEISDRFNQLPSPPLILQEFPDTDIKIIFTGPLLQAQKRLFELQPIRATMDELTPVAQMFPQILDKIDPDILAETILEAGSFPQKAIVPQEKVDEIRKRRAEAAQAQQQAQMAMGMADAFPKLSKKAESESPADNMMKAMAG